MDTAARRAWTREEFFSWAEDQEGPWEFDGVGPVAMTGGTINHSFIHQNISGALRDRLRGGPCRQLGPDAGVETVGNAVRFPDVVVICGGVDGTARTLPDPVVVFEVLSPTSGRTDRIVKVREYAAVKSILRYVVVESTTIGLTVFSRGSGEDAWTATTLTEGDVLGMPEVGAVVPVLEFYEGVDLPRG